MKPRDKRLIRRQLSVEDFHGHVAIDTLLKCAVHAPHRADSDELSDLDVTENLATQVRVTRGGRRDGAR
jgi:hypothetical protein